MMITDLYEVKRQLDVNIQYQIKNQSGRDSKV